MKKILEYICFVILGLMTMYSCEPLFDKLEGDLTKMTEEDMISSLSGLERLLSNVYNTIPMDDFNTKDRHTTFATHSKNTDYSIDVTGFWDYSGMRAINYLIKQIDVAYERGVINEPTRDGMLGEALFARAYCYFAMVRCYGGVPIVTEPLDDCYDGDENLGLYVPRSTEKETWDFVISELDKAIELLPESRASGSYRATKWSALGLQSRVALYAASVSKYWSKEAIPSNYSSVKRKYTYMDASYADDYYAKCIRACEALINSGRFSLYGGSVDSVEQAKENLTNLFLERHDCEFIFGKSYKNGQATASNDFDIYNSPHQAHAVATNRGWGNYSVTLDLVDLYDDYNADGGRADGTVRTRYDGNESEYFSQVSLPASSFDPNIEFIEYDDPAEPFLKKDARFQAWVLYPGCKFRSVRIVAQGGLFKSDGSYSFYTVDSEVLDGVTYYELGGSEEDVSAFVRIGSTAEGDHSLYWNTSFGIRKFLDPSQAIVYSSNPWYDIRYAEILLNYAEAVAESGRGDVVKARRYLNDIRHRAAFTDDIELTVENVLHERRAEFAFEGVESYTLHRRREYISDRNGGIDRKHTLLPSVDLRSGRVKYIFPRVNVYHGDIQFSSQGLNTNLVDYYGSIQNYNANRLTPNPSQE